MGDCPTGPLRPRFDRRLRLEFHGANVTSDAGLLAYRELDNALRLTDTAVDEMQDTPTGRNTRHGLVALLRQPRFSRRTRAAAGQGLPDAPGRPARWLRFVAAPEGPNNGSGAGSDPPPDPGPQTSPTLAIPPISPY